MAPTDVGGYAGMKFLRQMDDPRNLRRTLLICALLSAVTTAVFWPVLHNDFINYDDPDYIINNPHVAGGLSWENVIWAFRAAHSGNWHPLTWLSHMLDVQLFGLRPGWHHLTSVLFHGANAVLLFLLLQRITGAAWRSAFVAALFALHPLHVESVAWVAERKDVLSTFFFMLTLWAYARYAEGRRPKSEGRSPKAEGNPNSELRSPKPEAGVLWSVVSDRWSVVRGPWPIFYLLSLVFFACGLMSKPMLVTCPSSCSSSTTGPSRRLQIENHATPNSKISLSFASRKAALLRPDRRLLRRNLSDAKGGGGHGFVERRSAPVAAV